MSRGVAEPTQDKLGADVHPAFGLLGASRVTSTPGQVLFDSDIRHGHTVRVTLHTASRRRDLKQDWIHDTGHLFEVEMSEAQWASFVSTMNVGSGVPCTIRSTPTDYEVPGLRYAPRLAESMEEVHAAADEAFAEIGAAMAAYEAALKEGGAKARREALSDLQARIRNATPNVDYAGKRLAEHAENVVQKARADIEAIVTYKAAQLGLTAGDVGPAELLPGGAAEDGT